MGCLGFSKSNRNSSRIKQANKRKSKCGDEDASVWPLPAAAPPAPPPHPPDRSPIHVVRRSSSARRPHPLPAPRSTTTDFSSRGRSPPQPLPPLPGLPASTPWSARSSRQLLRRFDFERLARLCNQFAHRSQLRESVYRCFLEQEDMSVDVLLVRHCSAGSEDIWIEELTRVAQLEHPNVCRIIGFALSNSRRLVVFEAPASSSSVDEMLLLPLERSRARLQQLDFNWDTRLKIALAAAQGLAFFHQSSPLQASRFGPSNVLVNKTGKNRQDAIKLQLLLTEETSDSAKSSNVTSYGIFLLELLSGKMNMERLIIHGGSSSQGLFVKWARGVVNDSGKLSNILDPRLLLHCKPLSAARDLANFALTCLDQDPRLRPRMQQAVSLLKSLIAMRDLQKSSKMNARTVPNNSSSSPSSSSSGSSSQQKQQQQQQQFLGRSATFSYQARRRDLTPPPLRMSTDLDHHDWRQQATRSAGASPARYTSNY